LAEFFAVNSRNKAYLGRYFWEEDICWISLGVGIESPNLHARTLSAKRLDVRDYLVGTKLGDILCIKAGTG
jgi:hypothetical protein